MNGLDRITLDPDQMGGRACIRNQRVTVGRIVGQIGGGQTIEQLLKDYPYLEREDVMQALRYAAWRAEERELGHRANQVNGDARRDVGEFPRAAWGVRN